MGLTLQVKKPLYYTRSTLRSQASIGAGISIKSAQVSRTDLSWSRPDAQPAPRDCPPEQKTIQLKPMIEPEKNKLLLACIRGRWDRTGMDEAGRIVDENDVNWHDFFDQAGRQSVAPLIYHTLRDDHTILPPWVKRQLRTAYYRSATSNALLHHELTRIVRAFNEAEVPIILLKGAALAEGIYGNIALRPMGDIDLLVRTEQMSVAAQLLVQGGYSVGDRAHPNLRHATFRAGNSGWTAHIEVHPHIVSSAYYRRGIPEEWLWQDPVELAISEVSALGLSPEAAIVHSCLHTLDHIATKGNLLWLCDIVEVSRRYDVDWEALVDRVAEYRILLPFRSVLLACVEFLDLRLPDRVRQRLLAFRPGFLERKVYQLCLSPARSTAGKTLVDFLSVEGVSSKTQLMLSRLFPSREYMVARYSISNPKLVPLYYPHMITQAIFNAFRAFSQSRQA